jgi:hypothetical protein
MERKGRNPSLTARRNAAAAFTGSMFMVWGGHYGTICGDGARYYP